MLYFLSPMETASIPVQTPLLDKTHQQNHHQNHNNNHYHHHQKQQAVDHEETLLDKTLQWLDLHLSFLGFCQKSPLSFVLSWVGFLLVGVAVPVTVLELNHCTECEDYIVKGFEYNVVISQVLLGAVSLIWMSHNLRKRGVRNFLFVDVDKGHESRFMDQYITKFKGSYKLLLLSLIPCCILKLVHEIIRTLYAQNQPWWLVGLLVSASVIAWTYQSAIFLAACMLFHLSCCLQVIHFDDYGELLERESNISVLMGEHLILTHCLSKISHRFRDYLLTIFLIVTTALVVALMQISYAGGKINVLNVGSFAVTTVVQVVGTLLCLHAGTKISSKAHNIVAVACRWHALATCKPFEGSWRFNTESLSRSASQGSLTPNFSDSDLSTLDGFRFPTQSKLASVPCYNERQSFVLYLQTNPGGITLYGWAVDRSLLTQIFFLELSLVLFVFSQTIIYTSTPSS